MKHRGLRSPIGVEKRRGEVDRIAEREDFRIVPVAVGLLPGKHCVVGRGRGGGHCTRVAVVFDVGNGVTARYLVGMRSIGAGRVILEGSTRVVRDVIQLVGKAIVFDRGSVDAIAFPGAIDGARPILRVIDRLSVCDAVYGYAVHVVRRVTRIRAAMGIAGDASPFNGHVQHVFDGFALFDFEDLRNQRCAVNRDLQRCRYGVRFSA